MPTELGVFASFSFFLLIYFMNCVIINPKWYENRMMLCIKKNQISGGRSLAPGNGKVRWVLHVF